MYIFCNYFCYVDYPQNGNVGLMQSVSIESIALIGNVDADVEELVWFSDPRSSENQNATNHSYGIHILVNTSYVRLIILDVQIPYQSLFGKFSEDKFMYLCRSAISGYGVDGPVAAKTGESSLAECNACKNCRILVCKRPDCSKVTVKA